MKFSAFFIFLFLLLATGTFADTDEDRSAWLEAAREGDIEMIRKLLKKGVDIETQTNSGNSALKIASKKNHLELAEFLLAKGANINSRNLKKGSTPLHAAAWRNHVDMVKLLIKHGAELDSRTDKGNTALNLAAQKNYTDVIRVLLMAGAKIELPNNKGRTPLLNAANHASLEALQLLLANGADPVLSDNDGMNALQQDGTSSTIRDVLMGTMNATSIVFGFPESIDDNKFSTIVKAVLIARGWTPEQISPTEFYGDLFDDERIFRVHIKRIGANLLIEFTRGYGSNKRYYLENIKDDLLVTLKLKVTKESEPATNEW